MKAESVVFTGMQRPLTMLGLPPALLFGAAGGALMVMLAFVYSGLTVLALPALVASFAFIWWRLWRRQKADGHFGSVLFSALRFWGRPGRWSNRRARLVAGRPNSVRARRRSKLPAGQISPLLNRSELR